MDCLDFIFDSLPSSYTNLVGKPTTKIEAPKPSEEAYPYQVFFSYNHFPLKDKRIYAKGTKHTRRRFKVTILNQYLTCYTSIFVNF
jgi:hypothetical protein